MTIRVMPDPIGGGWFRVVVDSDNRVVSIQEFRTRKQAEQ